jgi:putative ABC transport system permease protein
MFKNYLKVAWRNIVRHKGYSAINIFGLAVGMAACLLLLLFIKDELSYDRYNENFARIHRVTCYIRFGGLEGNLGTVPAPLAAAMKQEFPEVAETVRFREQGNFIVRCNDRSYTESRLVFADASIFRVFTLPLRRGDPATALLAPRSIIVSEATAEKYFPAADPIGKSLRLDNETDYQITGVFKKIPNNSHFQFDLIASLNSLPESLETNWFGNNFFTYLLLRPGSDTAVLEAKLPRLILKYMGPQITQAFHLPIEKLLDSGAQLRYYLQPLAAIHLRSQLKSEIGINGNILFVYIFSAIALLILAIAAINFINLATARSAGRAKEAGIRKVLGSERRQLVGQFLADSLLMSGLAVLLALLLAASALTWFNSLTGKEIDMNGPGIGFMAASAALMTLLVGLVAGLYPAWRLAAAQPAEVLKGKLAAGVRGGRLRSVLVVSQFTVSIILIIGTLVIFRQLHYIQNKKLGFEKDQVLVLRNAYLLEKQTAAFKNEMLKNRAVVSGTVSGFLPVPPSNRNDNSIFPKGDFNSSSTVMAQNWTVDADYIKTMGMRIASGRDFTRDAPADRSAVIINQAAARQFGWQEPLGRQISFPQDSSLKTFIHRTVIGVVEDFHFESLHSPITPLVMFLGDNNGQISFRFQAEHTAGVLSELKRQWQHFAPGQPFEYGFMDARFAEMYSSEQRLGKIFSVFSGLGIFIACLGLLALASFMAERRTKEIGVRKVLGATVSEIAVLLSREFVKWVGIAALIAWPLAYYAMHRWLQGFAYRTGIGIGLFILSSLLALLIAIATVSFQAIRAARQNPVNSLRNE